MGRPRDRRNRRDGEAGVLACGETSCLYHDGRRCVFPWIERPKADVLDRGACRNYLLVEGDEYVARMSAIF